MKEEGWEGRGIEGGKGGRKRERLIAVAIKI